MANDQELRYKITTQADIGGADKAASAIEKVDQAAKDTGKSAGAAGDAMRTAGRDLRGVENATRSIGGLVRGNIRDWGNLGRVIGNIGNLLKTNPLFLLGSIAATVILPAFAKIREGWQKQAEAAEEARKNTVAAISAARVAGTERRTNALADQFAEVARRAKEAEQAIRRATAAEIERIDAEEAVELARFDDEAEARGFSDSQKTVGRAAIRQVARKRRETRQLEEIDRTVANAERLVEELRRLLPDAQEEVRRAEAEDERVRARSPQAIQEEIDQLRKTLPKRAQDRGPEDQQTLQRIADLRRELANAEKDYEDQVKATAEALRIARERLKTREDDVRNAIGAAGSAERDAQFRRGSVILGSDRDAELSKIEVDRALANAGLGPTADRTSLVQRQVRDREARIVREASTERAPAQSAVDGLTETVQSAPQPAPLDVGPLRKVIIDGQGKVITLLGQNQAAIDRLVRDLERTNARLENLENAKR